MKPVGRLVWPSGHEQCEPRATGSVAQEKTLKEKVVGTWILASITSSKDGADVPQPDLQGVLTYTADGYFHFVSMRKDLPKIAANDRTKPTPEEAMAVASGALAYFFFPSASNCLR